MSTGENKPLSERLRAAMLDHAGVMKQGYGCLAPLVEQARALEDELSEWRDPDSDRRQAIQDEIILAIGDGQRSEVDLREAQLSQAEGALGKRDDALRVCLEAFENDYHKDPGGDYARLIRATLGMCPAAEGDPS